MDDQINLIDLIFRYTNKDIYGILIERRQGISITMRVRIHPPGTIEDFNKYLLENFCRGYRFEYILQTEVSDEIKYVYECVEKDLTLVIYHKIA